MREVRYTSDAKENLIQIAIFVFEQSGSEKVALGVTDRLEAKCLHLSKLPGTLGRARPELREDIRSFPFENYVIFFRYTERAFENVNILHGSRDIEGYFSRT
jgi:toxin ParE1/3/4